MPSEFAMYSVLIWLFTLVITILVLCLCFLSIMARRAQKQESESLELSQLIIEGQEKENYRISRELHDVVLPLVKDTEIAGIIRSICNKLMPPDFSRLSLQFSIFDSVNKFAARTNIECVCSIHEQVDFSSLHPEKQLHLYRMIQEAFNNIEKHSRASKAILTARNTKGGGILICISDDGIGFSPAQKDHLGVATLGVTTPGLGLKSMQQRAAIIGAKLDFQSESGHGLTVRIELP